VSCCLLPSVYTGLGVKEITVGGGGGGLPCTSGQGFGFGFRRSAFCCAFNRYSSSAEVMSCSQAGADSGVRPSGGGGRETSSDSGLGSGGGPGLDGATEGMSFQSRRARRR